MKNVVKEAHHGGVIAAMVLLSACAAEQPKADTATPANAESAALAQRLLDGPLATPVQSPDSFRVQFETSRGTFTITVSRALSPRGADRFHEMVSAGYFTDVRFFRVVPGFVAQFGMHGDPKINDAWEQRALQDEPMLVTNARGTIVFATSGPDTRSNQLFINTADNGPMLDNQRMFAPFGRVSDGMDVVDKLYSEYGEEPGHAQPRIARSGNEYLSRWFPALDYIKSAKVVQD